MISEIVVIYTDGSLDLVWSFRPAVVTHKFPGYHWIYWVVPCLGTSLAAAFTFFSNGSNTRPYLALRYRGKSSEATASPGYVEKGMSLTGPGLNVLETQGPKVKTGGYRIKERVDRR
nr:hypothetical protein L203_06063 [Cryptococcus depauperatus CBS 7841]